MRTQCASENLDRCPSELDGEKDQGGADGRGGDADVGKKCIGAGGGKHCRGDRGDNGIIPTFWERALVTNWGSNYRDGGGKSRGANNRRWCGGAYPMRL